MKNYKLDLPEPHTPLDPADELVWELLSIGGPLSQIITGMLEFAASGRRAPDALSIPDAAFGVIRSVLGPVQKGHSKRDIRVCANIVRQVCDQICSEMYTVPPEYFDELEGGLN